MVLVEVYVASLEKSYDFQLDISTPIGEVIEDIISVISQKEEYDVSLDKEHLTLSVVDKETVMNKRLSLADYGVKKGMKLMLV